MRLTCTLAALLLVSCDDNAPTTTKAPFLPEPLAGVVLDRCVTRVRMTEPAEIVDTTSHMTAQGGAHASWRDNGGPSTIVDSTNFVNAPQADAQHAANFVFAVPLLAGPNHLEAGRCDAVDFCGWSAVDLTVTLGPGSPDPALQRTGQLMVPQFEVVKSLAALPGGRMLLGVESTNPDATPGIGDVGLTFLVLGADGRVERGFGTDGGTTLGTFGYTSTVAVAPGGGALVLLAHDPEALVVRLSATGVLDTSLGTMGFLHLFYPGNAASGDVQAIAALDGGGFVVAGGAVDGTATGYAPFVMELAADGSVVAAKRLAPGASDFRMVGAVIDSTGTASILTGAQLLEGTAAAGLTRQVPAVVGGSQGTLLPTPDGLAVATWDFKVTELHLQLSFIGDAGVTGTLELPLTRSFALPSARALMAEAPDGTLYLGGTIDHPAAPASSFTVETTPGTDFALVKVRHGTLDTTFGRSGVAHADFMLTRDPIALDTLLDEPAGLAVDSNGAPWLAGRSANATTQFVDVRDQPNRRVPQVGVVRFLP